MLKKLIVARKGVDIAPCPLNTSLSLVQFLTLQIIKMCALK